jgi:flagellar hook-associated protein 3 FlgL
MTISTLSLYQSAINGFQNTETALNKLDTQVSTGNVAQNFSDLGNNLSLSLNVRSLIGANNSYTAGNTLATNWAQTSDTALSQIENIATQLQSAITTERSSSGPTNPLAQTATGLLSTLQNLLNTQFNGQYVFAGAKTDTQPVNNLSSATNIVNGQPTDNYYSGDNSIRSIQAGAGINIQYGITANNPAIQNLVGALNLAIQGDNGNDATLASADTMVNTAATQLTTLRDVNDDNIKQLQNVNSNYSTQLTYLQQVEGNIDDTDITSASVQVANDQATLEASFELFSRISSLSLTQFLK